MKNCLKEHNKSVAEVNRILGKELAEHMVQSNEIDKLWDQSGNGEVLLAMNQKLNDLIGAEVSSDNGEFLPENKRGWALTHFDP